MGWTYTIKARGETIRDFFARELGFQTERRTVKLLDCAVVNLREAYLAFEDIDHTTGKREVFAVVCLIHYYPKSYHNFGYKDMEESVGPYNYKCPERILKLLTPTTNEFALKWRKKCWERIERIKSMPKFSNGDILEFEEPIKFADGTSRSRLEVVNKRRLRFQDPDGGYGYYRLSKNILVSNPFRVIKKAA